MTKGEAFNESVLFLGLSTKNGWKAGTLYAQKPSDGTGDFQWSRGDVADRINQEGVTESMGIDVPRVDYETGCPMLMIQDGGTWQDVAFNDVLDYTGDEGTIFVRVRLVFSENIQGIVTLADAGIFDDYISLWCVMSGGIKTLRFQTYTNPDENNIDVVLPDDGNYNIAIAYKLSTGAYSFAVNGIVEDSGTFANNVPLGVNLDRLYLGSIGSFFMENSRLIGLQYFSQKLDDTSLENITA